MKNLTLNKKIVGILLALICVIQLVVSLRIGSEKKLPDV